MELYDNIKNLREKLGMSQEALAEKTGYRDRSSIAKIEAGKVDLTQSKIAAFSKALNVSPAFLMGITDETSQDRDGVETDKRTYWGKESDLSESLISRLVQLTPAELEKVDAFVQGLLASR